MQFDTCFEAVIQRPLVAIGLEYDIQVGQAEERQHGQVSLPMPTMGRRIDQDTITLTPQDIAAPQVSVEAGNRIRGTNEQRILRLEVITQHGEVPRLSRADGAP